MVVHFQGRFPVGAWLAVVLAGVALVPAWSGPVAPAIDEDPAWETAAANGARAAEAMARCRRLLHAWYGHAGTGNALLPRNLRQRVWNTQDAAADNWSFQVITAYLTDPDAYGGMVRQTLRDELRLTTRVGSLGDAYQIDGNRFVRRAAHLPSILFGASEYVKDGILPIAELTGRTAWFERGRQMLIDIMTLAPVETRFGRLPAASAEVCGEMLQALSRYYGATGDPRFARWARTIAEAWVFEVLPRNNGLPCHGWDFQSGRPADDRLSLNDHGNEIIFGLAEVLMLAHVHDQAWRERILPGIQGMIDWLLAHAVNDHGLWVGALRPSTGEILDAATPDTWGYALNAVYVLYLVTGQERYRDAVVRAMRGINADPRYANWGGADSFADAIEGAILLVNRIREPETLAWMDKTVPAFLGKQRDDGIVEGWHGDGNYARTALMLALMLSGGTRVTPWREDLRLGVVIDGDALLISLDSDAPWRGRLHLDLPRHRLHLGLAVDYPRLNQFPEWYTVDPVRLYGVVINGKPLKQPLLGDDLAAGLPLESDGGGLRLRVSPLPGPPYGDAPGGPAVESIEGGARIVFAEEMYANRGYQWCGEEPIAVTFPVAAGQAATLHLLWGAKGDQRTGLVRVGETVQAVTRGGYDGFEWVTIPVATEQTAAGYLAVQIAAPESGKAAFIAEAKVTTP